jgi:predicted acyltransferase
MPARMRALSLDTFRGIVMLFLLFDGAVPAWTAHFLAGNQMAGFIAYQFTHAAWAGCTLWDLGQPAFLFMSGMAIPFAIASRRARGAGWFAIWARVLRRSLLLIALGLLIRSNGLAYTDFGFVHDVLLQMGLAAPFACLIATQTVRRQIIAAVAILVGYWLLFVTHPVVAVAPGIPADWTPFTGLFAHWNRYGNFAADFDRWFLNLFPRPTPFAYDDLGLATLNFVPSIVTMVVGALAGALLRGPVPPREKVRRLALAGVGCVVTGWLLGQTLCPVVKLIWTPSWTIFSAGWALLGLLLLYWVVDMRGMRRWTYGFVVLGVNALFVYLLLRLFSPWMWMTLSKHLGAFSFTVDLLIVNGTIWLAAAWLYKRRVVLTA